MRQITVISGKGGTGKTSLVAAFASLASPCVVADCDVDAANLHLILQPLSERMEPVEFRSGNEVIVDPDRCTGCGVCQEVCRFGAIQLCPTQTTGPSTDQSTDWSTDLPTDPPEQTQLADGAQTVEQGYRVAVDALVCEGCGACVDACPTGCLSLREKVAGELRAEDMRYGVIVRGRLGIAQATSGKLVNLVRTKACEIASQIGSELVLIDGSPGIGCSVISSLTGTDLAVIVAEPTVSGIHDMGRAVELCKHFSVQPLVVVNKSDLNPEAAAQLVRAAELCGATVVGEVNYDPIFPKAAVSGKTVLECAPESSAAAQIRAIWRRIAQLASAGKKGAERMQDTPIR